MRSPRLVLGRPSANPRSVAEFLCPYSNQSQGPPPAPAHEAGELQQTGIVGVDGRVLDWLPEFLVVSSHTSLLGFRVIPQEYVSNLVCHGGARRRIDTKSTETCINVREGDMCRK